MNYTIEDLEPGEKLIKVMVSVAEQQPYLDRASVSLSEQKNIDGFRPGKAPRGVVEKKFGAMAILERALEDIVNSTYYEILKQEKLQTVGRPQVEFKKMVPGEDLEYTARVSLLPQVVIGDISKIKVPKPQVKVEDKDVEAVIKDLQKMRAKEVAVDRPARRENKVEIDFEVRLDNVTIEGGVGKKYPLVLGEGMFIPGFEDQVVGMKVGQSKKFKLRFPNDYKADLRGKEADFEVKLLSVFERQLPSIDDELAKQAGNYQTLVDLKKQIRANLEADYKAKADQEWEVKILEKLLAISNFSSIPKILVNNEIHRMMHELEDNLSQRGLKMSEYLAQLGKTKQDLETDWQSAAQKRVKTALLARQLADDKNIKASEEEINKEKQKMLDSYKDKSQVRDNIESQDFHDYLFHTLTNRKVINYLKEVVGS